MSPLPIGMNSAGPFTYQEHLSLIHHIYDCVRRIGILERRNRFQLSPLSHIYTYLIDEPNVVLRRPLIPNPLSPFKFSVAKHKGFEKGYKLSCIPAKLDCFFRSFQALVLDIHQGCPNIFNSQLGTVNFLLSRLAIINPAPSVPSCHVLFRSFKNMCDFFYILDINEREHFLTRVGSLTSSTTLICVLGTTLHDDVDSPMIYFIGCYISSNE